MLDADKHTRMNKDNLAGEQGNQGRIFIGSTSGKIRGR